MVFRKIKEMSKEMSNTNLLVKKTCSTCGKVFYVGQSRRDTAKFCSHKCRRPSKEAIVKHTRAMRNLWAEGKMENCRATCFKGGNPLEHPKWKGGRIKDKYGYVLIYNPDHPLAVKGRYVREHRGVMEEHLGRVLKPEEVVHHINGIKDDNRIENLALCTNNAEHIKKYHKENPKVSGKSHPMYKHGKYIKKKEKICD